MISIRDLMTSDPMTLSPEMSLRDAIDELSSAGVSGAPVVSGGELRGVVSASDILLFQTSTPGVPSYRQDLSEPLEPSDDQLREESSSEPFAAFFTELWADSTADLVERFAGPEGPEWDALSEHEVREVMTGRVFTLPPDTDADEAARVMKEHSVHRIVVTEDKRVVGIVSSMDFVRAVAEGRLR